MHSSRKSRILIVSVILVISGIQGQIDDFMKICDLCNLDGLLDCNSTNIFHINMTVNCEMTNKMCTLGINESFEGFENLTLNDIDQAHICIFKEISKDPAFISPNVQQGMNLVHMIATTEANSEADMNVISISDIQSDDAATFSKTTLNVESVDSSVSKIVSTEKYDDLATVDVISSSEYQKSLLDKDTDSSMSTMIPTSTGSFKNTVEDIEISYFETTPNTQLNDQTALLRSSEDTSEITETNSSISVSAMESVPCFACESLSNEACLGRIDELKSIDCPKESGCLSYYLDGNVIRDCGSKILPNESDLCGKHSNFTCDKCHEPKCNRKSWNQCFQCNSKDDSNCAQWSNAETVTLAVCKNFNDNCLVRITNDGNTIRECSPPSTKCSQGEVCSFCEGPLCNAGVFPENRLRCIQCQECEDAQDPDTALPCVHYNPNEECFLYVTATSKMIRGCVSNITEMQECQHNEPKCITCGKQNGCNSVSMMKDPTLSCSKCKSKDNPECAWHQPDTAVSKCVNQYLYYLTETCLMDFDPSSQEAVRDCSFDYGVCTSDDHDCHSCFGNGCNRGNLKVQQCIQCQSNQSGQVECQNQAVGISPTKCLQKNQSFQTRGCFAMTKGNVTTRGCVASLTADDSKHCQKEGQTWCTLCMDDGCNNMPAPSLSGMTIKISWIALFGVFLFMI